ncbi:EF-hand domain-containing protein [Sphingobium nicotianae]|uniref:EF-hand domain-containing protein n=1 Tax=Sphingobium nicotianae TaxID=2782607 RepID=A0A9X1DD25_9SPHN|nr:EF-hand domain-containing protein [Sphingobium nicotianae]MBT2187674.1 EF-hand domain-containing protein [Sphingobium nicotianae]
MSKRLLAAAALATILSGGSAFAQPERGPQGPQTRDQYIAAAKARFAVMDASGDGIVTRDEVSAQIAKRMGDTPRPEMVDRMFSRLDTDGDGKATTAEVEAAAGARFDALDTDKNGTLTPEEQAAGFRGMMRRQ